MIFVISKTKKNFFLNNKKQNDEKQKPKTFHTYYMYQIKATNKMNSKKK